MANIFNYLDNLEIIMDVYPHKQNVLVLAPHPDDESIGCGGTIRLMVNAGCQVDVAFVTVAERAEQTETAQREIVSNRIRNLHSACNTLGVREKHFLTGYDGSLHLQPYVSEGIEALLNKNTYDCVFVPWAYDSHSDHAKTFLLLTDALKKTKRNIEVWMYEVWNPLPANRVIGIEPVANTKVDAIRCYDSENRDKHYDEVAMGLARYRGLIASQRLAEAFLVCDRPFALQLAATVERSFAAVRAGLKSRLNHPTLRPSSLRPKPALS